MQVRLKKAEVLFRNSMYLGVFVLFVSIGIGCASTKQTTKTETTTTYPDQVKVNSTDKEIVTQSQTTTTTSDKPENPGILSSTFHAIGYVLALPFIIVGGFFNMIFGG